MTLDVWDVNPSASGQWHIHSGSTWLSITQRHQSQSVTAGALKGLALYVVLQPGIKRGYFNPHITICLGDSTMIDIPVTAYVDR